MKRVICDTCGTPETPVVDVEVARMHDEGNPNVVDDELVF